MSLKSLFSLLALCALTVFFACGNDQDVRDAATESVSTPSGDAAATTSQTTPPPATTPEPAQNAEGVWHYTCPNGCEGGAGALGACPKCGAQLAHNQAYHASNSTQTTPPVQLQNNQPAATPEPAQNAAGVWHYICQNGCEGGAGTLGACPKCGAQLAHNQLYHQ